MEARLRAVMLLTSDLPRAMAFYDALGLPRTRAGADLAIYDVDGGALALVTKPAAERLTGLVLGAPPDMPSQFLVHQARSRADVDAIVSAAEQAGARVLRRPADNDWGGYAGAFADPDGHAWTIGHNVEFYKKG